MQCKVVIIVYGMGRAPVRVLQAPLRLRYEHELGFQKAKWVATIEF